MQISAFSFVKLLSRSLGLYLWFIFIFTLFTFYFGAATIHESFELVGCAVSPFIVFKYFHSPAVQF